MYLRYAQVLHLQQKFEEAKEQYQKYQQLKPEDDRSQRGIESCDFAREALDNPSRYIVEPLNIANSRAKRFCSLFLVVAITMCCFLPPLVMEEWVKALMEPRVNLIPTFGALSVIEKETGVSQ